MKKYTIHDLPIVDRPREKLLKYGPNKLETKELLAIIIRSGTKGKSAIQIAHKILHTFPEEELQTITVSQLQKIPGIGAAKACEIIACFELGKRILKSKQTRILLTAKDIFDELKDIRKRKKEHFVVFYLDIRSQEIKKEVISVGILNSSLVHPREVFETAIKNNCAQIVVAHNHPSGEVKPSEQDVDVTRRLVKSGEILGIKVVDHVIVTENKYFSFSDNHML